MPSRPEIRTLTGPEDLHEWCRAVNTGFLNAAETSPEEVAARAEAIVPDRTQGAYEAGRCVATFRTAPQLLTVPGGAVLPSSAVTNVTVSPTHRRRGLLSTMTGRALRAAAERGDACASLVSAEYPIYGRYGFGPATWATEWDVHLFRTGLDRRYAGPADLGDGGRVDLLEPAEVRRVVPELHERYRVQEDRQGVVDRTERWWRVATGELRVVPGQFSPALHAVYRDAAGVPQGYAAFSSDAEWRGAQPEQTVTVRDLWATTPAGEAALWRFVLALDWASRVRTGHRAPDDVLPLLLPDPRGARMDTYADFLWLRPLDVPRMLAARTYGATGTLVLELRDKDGWADGRYRLEAGPEGAECAPTRQSPDLSLDVAELATFYLGDEAIRRLAALGRVAEHRAGAVRLADTLFRTGRRAWCPDVF